MIIPIDKYWASKSTDNFFWLIKTIVKRPPNSIYVEFVGSQGNYRIDTIALYSLDDNATDFITNKIIYGCGALKAIVCKECKEDYEEYLDQMHLLRVLKK